MSDRMGPRKAMELASFEGQSWVQISGAELRMGSLSGEPRERPPHPVQLSAFRIARYPVTNLDYAAFRAATGSAMPAHWKDGTFPAGMGDHPVVQVTWGEAMAFCAWLTGQIGGDRKLGRVHLATEAQWELVARGHDGREFPWGDDEPADHRANYDAGLLHRTTAVTQYPDGATPEGVFDLAGNVLEWCWDWFGPYPAEQQRDPTGPDAGLTRVLRGCSFKDPPWGLRGAARRQSVPDSRYDYVGFRVVFSSVLDP